MERPGKKDMLNRTPEGEGGWVTQKLNSAIMKGCGGGGGRRAAEKRENEGGKKKKRQKEKVRGTQLVNTNTTSVSVCGGPQAGLGDAERRMEGCQSGRNCAKRTQFHRKNREGDWWPGWAKVRREGIIWCK